MKNPEKVSWIYLLWINLVVKKRNCVEYVKVLLKYYSNPLFRKADTGLLFKYFFKNPFVISKKFLIKRGEEDIYAYGETPLTTMDLIAKECRISSADTVFELGCGRGRTCFWLACILNCRVVGIEYIPQFVEKSNAVKQRCKILNLQFRCEDFLKANLKGATVIYLYGTCLDKDSIKTLIDRFSYLPAGTKIITVSFSLNEYAERPIFEVLKRFSAPFTWGNADVYLHLVLD
jgi:SAM-dependent methyltransferase